MVGSFGNKLASNPMLLIGILIAAIVLIKITVPVFPLIVSSVVELGALGNFTFASLFTSTGVVTIVLSALVLVAVLAIFGIRSGMGGKR